MAGMHTGVPQIFEQHFSGPRQSSSEEHCGTVHGILMAGLVKLTGQLPGFSAKTTKDSARNVKIIFIILGLATRIDLTG
jgi:hypothetical protein